MHSVLVVYATGSGCTAGIGERIGRALADRGATVTVTPAKDAPDPSGYDAVIVGSGVRAGQWHAAARKWVSANAAALKARPVAFYTVGLTMATNPEKAGEVRAYTDLLIAATGVTPVEIGLFAGSNEPAKFSFVERTILGMMKGPNGDFRNWDAIDAWSAEAAGKLGIA